MAIKVRRFSVDPNGSHVIIQLQSANALPLEGVMAALNQTVIAPERRADPTIVTWHVPPESNRYVLYGIVTPLSRLFRAPRYVRVVAQDGTICRSRSKNPVSLKTRKLNAGEWVGPPEVISIEVR